MCVRQRNGKASLNRLLPNIYSTMLAEHPAQTRCLHKIAQKTDGYRDSCNRKPTRCLHEAYISLHGFGALWRGNENHLTHLQVLYFLQVNKFSREFCSIQAE